MNQTGAAVQLGQILNLDRILNDALTGPALGVLNGQATVDQLASALSFSRQVTYSDGVVSYNDTVTPITTNGDVQFDVDINSSATFSEQLNLGSQAAALGLTINSPPTINGTADSHIHFTVDLAPGSGQDQYVFTMDFNTQDPNDPAPLQLSLNVNDSNVDFTAQLPGIAGNSNLTVSNGAFDFTPSVAATFNNVNAQGIASITLNDLETQPVSNLIGLTPSGQLSASQEINSTLPSPLNNLGTVTITAHDSDVFSGAAPDVSLSFNLTPQIQTQVLNVLQQLDNVGDNISNSSLLNTQIPLVDTTINQLFNNGSGTDLGSYFKFHDAVQSYFNSLSNGELPTADGLANVLVNQTLGLGGSSATGDLARGPISITAGLNSQGTQLLFHVVVDLDRTVNLPLDFSAAAQDLGLSITGGASANVDVALDVDADFGINLSNLLNTGSISSQDVFFQLNNALATAQLNATNVNLGVQLGFLDAGVTNGTVNLTAGAALTVQKPGSSPGTYDNTITLYDLDSASNPNALSLGSLISFQPTSSLTANLPLQASIEGTQIFTDPSNPPSIQITDADLFNQVPTITANFGALGNFQNIGPVQMLALLNQITDFLNQYRQSDIFNIPIPFVANTTLGTLFDLGTSYSNRVLVDLETSGASIYSQADVPDDYTLTSDGTLTLEIDGGSPILVTIPATPAGAGPQTISSLVVAISQALQNAGISADQVTVQSVGNRIQLLRTGTVPTQPSEMIDPTKTLQITAATGSAVDELHFAAGQLSSNPNAPTPLFNTVEDLAVALVNELGLNTGFGPVASYDASTGNLTFHLSWSDTFPTLTLPLNLNLNLGDLANLTTSATATLTSGVTFNFTFGINLASTSGFSLTGALTRTDPSTGQTIGVTPMNGRLVSDAHFQVIVGNNPPVMVTVPQSSTSNDQTLYDLAAAINTALQNAGLQTVQTNLQQQSLTLTATAGQTLSGTYTLSLDGETTTPIAVGASAATVQDALAALSNVGAGNVTVTGPDGGPYTIQFNKTVDQLLVATDPTDGTATVADTSPTAGSVAAVVDSDVIKLVLVGNQWQTLTLTANQGQTLSGTYTLSLDNRTTDPIDVGASAADVQAALAALPIIGSGNVTVTGAPGGPYSIQFSNPVDNVLVATNPSNGTASVQDSLQVSAEMTDPAVTQLEFPGNGQLPADATFQLTINGGSPVTVTVTQSATANDISVYNPANPLDPTTLVGAINAALATAGLSGQVLATAEGNRISFQPVSGAGVNSLMINAASNDPTLTVLGFQNGQSAQGSADGLFFGTGNILTANAQLSVNSNPGNSVRHGTAGLCFA